MTTFGSRLSTCYRVLQKERLLTYGVDSPGQSRGISPLQGGGPGTCNAHPYILYIYTVYTLEFNHDLKHGGSFWMMIKPLKKWWLINQLLKKWWLDFQGMLYTWNPNDPCFDSSLGLLLEGFWATKYRTFTGSRYIHTLGRVSICLCDLNFEWIGEVMMFGMLEIGSRGYVTCALKSM